MNLSGTNAGARDVIREWSREQLRKSTTEKKKPDIFRKKEKSKRKSSKEPTCQVKGKYNE